jgi:ABC-type nitrate/sulfonate/bicarbonate transport system substrate-binding protein
VGQGYSSRGDQAELMVAFPNKVNPVVNLLRLGAIGPCAAIAPAAQRQGLFHKHGGEVRLILVPGTEVPALSEAIPMAHIGAPAALMRASRGDDVKIIASFDSGRCSGCLVVRPEIVSPQHLRGQRLGARVRGAAMWIQTFLALRAMGSIRDGMKSTSLRSAIPRRSLQHYRLAALMARSYHASTPDI